jgi:putative ABC transport system permease protein
MNSTFNDLRYAIRIWLKRPGFAATVILTLALGIGANTAIFSVVHSVLINPLPLPESDQLVTFWLSAPSKKLSEVNLTPGLFVNVRERTKTLENVAAYETGSMSFTGRDEPEQLEVAAVTADYFRVLGVDALAGRTFLSGEDAAGSNPVAVLSYELWQRRFAGADIVGQSINLDNKPTVVVGVMPRATNFPNQAEQPNFPAHVDLWVPLNLNPSNIYYWNYAAVGRLKPGIRIQDARSEINALWSDFYRQNESQLGVGALGSDPFAILIPLKDRIVGNIRLPLIVLLVGVGLVLLIACANIANLLLARAILRSREIAVRRCLGASRTRIITQLITESLLLAVIGGILGLLFASWGVSLLREALATQIPLIESARLNPQVLVFTFTVSLLTGVLFGLAPAVRGARISLQDAIKEGARGSASRATKRLGDVLVISQIALSLVLLTSALLLLRSFKNLTSVDPGFVAEHRLSATLSLPESRYTDENQIRTFYAQLMDRLPQIPGVRSAALCQVVPFSGGGGGYSFTVEGYVPGPGEPARDAWRRSVTPNYFDTMGISLLRGRYFESSDAPDTTLVAIVDEKLAREYWPNDDPIGKRLKLGGQTSKVPWLTIVGVVRSVKNRRLDEDAKFYVYQPFSQWPRAETSIVLNTTIEPKQVVAGLRTQVAALDPSLPIFDITTVEESVARSVNTKLLASTLLAIFAITALLLAVIGIYGVISLNVTNRINEFGIRMALGAQPGNVRTLVLGEGMRVAAIGGAVGLLVALMLTRLLEKLLFGVTPTDPLTFAAVTAVLTIASLLASYVPARRATKVDPLVALRYE